MKVWCIAALLGGVALVGCGSSESSDRAGRVSRVIEACNGHGGVVAFDDDAVICEDQTSSSERASRAVDACRDHEGVAAFDDDIVICRDQTSHEAQEG
jgi:formylmethanofuran:tetrahydromethanopterin formyltransferase